MPTIKAEGTKKSKLDGTASEMRRLLVLFLVAVAKKVKDFEDPVWEMVLHLRRISSAVCASALSYEQIALLKLDIDSYLRLRIECFPEEKLNPKHEYLRHYPMLIFYFGPLKHVWTLRFESKHREFKTDVRNFTNFKNIIQTLADKHQLKQSASPAISESFVESKTSM